MADTILWISGASGGIGSALARNVPFRNARVINIDIQPSPDFETLLFDLSSITDWRKIAAHFQQQLQKYKGGAYFFHCAYSPRGKGLVTAVDFDDYTNSLLANTAGSIAVASAFVRAVRPEQESGLMLMSSKAAQFSLPGYSAYSSSKVALEKWVKITRKEIGHRGWGPWIVAARPGLVDTPTARAASSLPADIFPLGKAMAEDLARKSMTPDQAAQRLWGKIPPAPEQWLIDLDEFRAES